VDSGPPEKHSSVIIFKMLGEKEWVERKVTVEGGLLRQRSQLLSAYTGNTAWLKGMESIAKELTAKAYIYNMLINLEN